MKKYFIHNDCFLLQKWFFNSWLDAIFNRRRFCLLTSAYFITREACEKFLKIGYPVRMPADVLLGHVASNHLKMYRTHPCKYVESVTDIGSDISKRPPMRLY